MNDERFLTATEDELEQDFLDDYARFATSINPNAIITLLNTAAHANDHDQQKPLAIAGIQLFYASLEDFAALLQALLHRRTGAHLHNTLTDQQQRGTTNYPSLLKQNLTAQELMDTLGFTNTTVNQLQALGYDLTEETFNDPFADFADSIKNLATYAENYNTLKNRLKHGKAIFGHAFGLTTTDDIGHIETRTIDGHDSRGLVKSDLSLDQLRVAAILTCKITIVTLDLLALGAVHYHPAFAPTYTHTTRDAAKRIAQLARNAGLSSKGLTNLFTDES